MQLHVDVLGTSGPVLLLLHGAACHGGVWEPFVAQVRERWPGRIVVPDLRGHGRSPHGRHYRYGNYAADLADLFGADDPVYVVGHSMGGALGCVLASGWFGIDVQRVFAFAVKGRWGDAELEKTWAMAKAPVRWMTTREEAADRFLKFAGLSGFMGPDAPAVTSGIREEGGRWRLAMDPGIFATPRNGFDRILGAARVPVRLASGSQDAMAPLAMTREFDAAAFELPGLGHNAHIEAPAVVAEAMWLAFEM